MGLKFGDNGPAVTALQNALIGLGFPLTADGQFGSRTDDAVRGLQLVTGLTVDGEVGALTNAALSSGTWPNAQGALMFTALARIQRTDSETTHVVIQIVTADVKFPIALPDGFTAPAINPGLRALAEKRVADAVADPPVPDDPSGPSFVTGELEPTLIVGSLLGVHGNLSTFLSGAAHPNPVVVTAVADFPANRFLKPSELFMQGASWMPVLRSLAIAAFPGANAAGLTATAKNYKHLTLTPTGVKVVFEAGQILPLVAGAPAFVAPWSGLVNVIRPSIVARCLGGSPGGPGPHLS